jgi:hypothetical protein
LIDEAACVIPTQAAFSCVAPFLAHFSKSRVDDRRTAVAARFAEIALCTDQNLERSLVRVPHPSACGDDLYTEKIACGAR